MQSCRSLGAVLAVWLVLAWMPAGAVEVAADQALLDRVIAAYGGRAALEQVRALRTRGRVETGAGGAHGTVVRDYAGSDKLRVEVKLPQRRELRLLDGARVWRGIDQAPREVTGVAAAAIRFQLLRSAVPWVFANLGERLIDAGARDWRNRHYRIVGLRWSGLLTIGYWVSADSGRVERVDGALRAGGQLVRFSVTYEDFRGVDGLMVPFHEEIYASGRHTGTTRIDVAQPNPPSPGPFQPGAGELL